MVYGLPACGGDKQRRYAAIITAPLGPRLRFGAQHGVDKRAQIAGMARLNYLVSVWYAAAA